MTALSVTHYLEDFLPAPERFDVDRFVPERAEGSRPGVFVRSGWADTPAWNRDWRNCRCRRVQCQRRYARTMRRDQPCSSIQACTRPLATNAPAGSAATMTAGTGVIQHTEHPRGGSVPVFRQDEGQQHRGDDRGEPTDVSVKLTAHADGAWCESRH